MFEDDDRPNAADDALAASVLASCLTYAQRDLGERKDNDALGEALWGRLRAEGWILMPTASSSFPVESDAHTDADCERNLKAMPNFSISQGVPAVFVCECGQRWEHVEDEADGGGWEKA